MKPLVFALFSITALAQTKSDPFDKTAFEQYLRHLELYLGQVEFKIDDPKPFKHLPGFSEVDVHVSTPSGSSKDEVYYVAKDGTIIDGNVYKMGANPFQTNLDKLNTRNAPTFGPPDAPITIVEFADLECPDCRMEAPVLRQTVQQSFPGKVRVFFKDYPLESIHPWARAAAIAGRCVYRQDAQAFWKFYDWMYDTQDQIDPTNLSTKVLDWAGSNGVDGIQLGRCMDTKATEAEVNQSIAEGRSLQLKGTPTLFINGRKIGGLDGRTLEKVLQIELDYLAKKK
jgi:protein-disulfide isomerase